MTRELEDMLSATLVLEALAREIRYGTPEILRSFLAQKSPDAWARLCAKGNPWADLAQYGTLAQAEVLQEYLPYSDEPLHHGLTPYLWAAKSEREDLMPFFLAHGADPEAMTDEGKTIWELAPEDTLLAMAAHLPPLTDADIDSVFNYAMDDGKPRLLRLLLDHGLDPLHVLVTGHCGQMRFEVTPWSRVQLTLVMYGSSPRVCEMARMLVAVAGARIPLEEVLATGDRSLVYAWVELADVQAGRLLVALDPLADLPREEWGILISSMWQQAGAQDMEKAP